MISIATVSVRRAATTTGPRPASAVVQPGDGEEFATYRISVGKRHRVVPGAIVGAIANEGGLRRSDFGHISIRPDYSLVELPANLSNETLEALRRTRISGVLIQLTPDQGAPAQRLNARGPRRDREARPRTERRKPRT